MGRILIVVLSIVSLDIALGYSTSGASCDVFCMNNVRILETGFAQDLSALFDGDHLAVHCTSKANMSACFDAVPQCSSGMETGTLFDLLDYVCDNQSAFETNKPCFDDHETRVQMVTCYMQVNRDNYCDLPTCILNSLSAVSSCSNGGKELISGMMRIMTSDAC